MGKRKFALPQEDEWEYACRGGKGNKQAFYFGDQLNGKQANCDGRAPYGDDQGRHILDARAQWAATKTSAPHPWGLCDMHGNVEQWCQNKFHYKKGGPEWDKNDLNALRVVRGGCWASSGYLCRSANRDCHVPGIRDDFCDRWYGLRIAVVP